MNIKTGILLVLLITGYHSTAQSKSTTQQAKQTLPKQQMVEIITPFGNMTALLYDSTPQHRDNFIKMVKQNFYDSLLFHRVIEGFMIQGGDPTSKYADSTAMLGGGEAPGGMIPAEINTAYIHKKGALAAARNNNPEKASSNSQFYIVQGKPQNLADINNTECGMRMNNPEFFYTDEQRKIYTNLGGTPQLDENYTIFGEVIKGLDVIDKIASAETNEYNRPMQNIRMKIIMLN